MQEKDIILKEYQKDNAHFCSFVNGVLAGGRRLLKPEYLETMPTELLNISDVPEEATDDADMENSSHASDAAQGEDHVSCALLDGNSSRASDAAQGEDHVSCALLDGNSSRASDAAQGEGHASCALLDGNSSHVSDAAQGEDHVSCALLDENSSSLSGSDSGYSGAEVRRIKTIHRFRDLTKKYHTGDGYIIIAIQNQSTVDFGMPLRVMLEDALEYDAQRRLCKNERLHQNEQLMAVITIVFYHGQTPWSGAKNLADIVKIPKELKELERYKPSYSMVLVTADSVNAEQFDGGWREVFEILKCQNDPSAMLHLLQHNAERYLALPDDTKKLLFALIGNLKYYKKAKKEGREIDMCKAFEDYRASGVKEGIEIGLERGRQEGLRACIDMCREFCLSPADTLAKIQEKFSLTETQAQECMRQYF